MKHTTRIITLMTLITVALLTGCSKPDTTIPTRFGSLYLHLHTNIGNTEISLGQSYPSTTIGFRNISITSARYYISNIVMTDSAGRDVSISGIVLAVAGTDEYAVGQIPIGTYKNISFKVGLESFSNHGDPTKYGAGNPLGVQNPAMHFGIADSGYFFADVRGNIDTTGAGTPTAPFSCQIGLDQNLGSVSMPDHITNFGTNFVVVENQPLYIHMIADFGQFFHSIDLAHNLNLNPRTAPAMDNLISQNMSSMFRYEE